MTGAVIKGNIPVLDIQYGNVWTNIGSDLFNQLHLKYGDSLQVAIYHNGKKLYQGKMPYCQTFGAVVKGKPLVYLNSLLQVSFALNQKSFADIYHVSSGSEWSVEIRK
jgi:S-adenosylmethionine hydrolase